MTAIVESHVRHSPQTSTRRSPARTATTTSTAREAPSTITKSRTSTSTISRKTLRTTTSVSSKKALKFSKTTSRPSASITLTSSVSTSTLIVSKNVSTHPPASASASKASTWIPRPWRPTEYPSPGFVEHLTIQGIPAGLRQPPKWLDCRPGKVGMGMWGLYMDPHMHGCLRLRIFMMIVILVGTILGTIVGWRYSRVETRTKKKQREG